MSEKIRKVLENKGDNYILPFFWQHGEDEETLRKYMDVIEKSNIRAVCVESRPHPDYCGEKWWADMDVILDEARKRDMKVWILDDSHFPTGFANGAIKDKPVSFRRQSITFRRILINKGETLKLDAEELRNAAPYKPNEIEQHFSTMGKSAETDHFSDDRLLGILAVRTDKDDSAQTAGDPENAPLQSKIDLSTFITEDGISWTPEKGSWKVMILNLTRNRGPHRDYINMMDHDSVRVLIDAVYEPHFEHYKDDFGKAIAGFFSDEPELGNGHLYEKDTQFGSNDDEDYPWSADLEAQLKERLGEEYPNALALLWDNEADAFEKARVRYTYMDCVTRLVEKHFSFQLGDWCRAHGVKYIGHIIEDNNMHARTGSTLGHYFRSLAGEDMSGIDDIGGQVIPQGEDLELQTFLTRRDGEFYHYMLGKLASSAAAIEPLKHGDAMCEIFGAYGWGEGVAMEKYLIDHMMVRGVNHFVPHAFSPKEFPDPDCPPHFYAHGHNPQYRHFGCIMAYANRVCELITGGKHAAPAAVLYHGEAEWMGKTSFSQKAGRAFADAQIEYDYIPADVFADPGKFNLEWTQGKLLINGQEYRLFAVPEMEFLTEAAAKGISAMIKYGIPAVYVDKAPAGIGNGTDENETGKLWEEIKALPVVALGELAEYAKSVGAAEISITPENNRIRYYHYIHQDNTSVYMMVNEGTESWTGSVAIPELSEKQCPGEADQGTAPAAMKPSGLADDSIRSIYLYDAWNNCIEKAGIAEGKLNITIEPLHSRILVIDRTAQYEPLMKAAGLEGRFDGYQAVSFGEKWVRGVCTSLEYPNFVNMETVQLPEDYAVKQPLFSGFLRYENSFRTAPDDDGGRKASYILEISDASEGVEVFVNGISLGIQVAPPFRYELTQAVHPGVNNIAIEAATTLEREMSQIPSFFGMKTEPKSKSGLTGEVKLYRKVF